jgi:hypothetical protein
MNQAEARQILEALRGELESAVAKRTDLEKREAAIRKLIDGYLELFPGLASHQTLMPLPAPVVSLRPRGQEAVLRVMEDSVGKWWTVGTMVHELEKRGWLPESEQPANAVRVAMERVVTAASPPYFKDKGASGTVTFSYRPFEAAHPGAANGQS